MESKLAQAYALVRDAQEVIDSYLTASAVDKSRVVILQQAIKSLEIGLSFLENAQKHAVTDSAANRADWQSNTKQRRANDA